MKKIVLIAAVVFLAGMGTLQAQNYKTSIGFRGVGVNNQGMGLTIKHFMGSNKAIEGILATRYHGWSVTGLLEFDNAIGDVDGLSWFYGFGGHLGNYPADSNGPWYDPNDPYATYTIIGADLILGLEFTIPNAPIAFQLDWKPVLNLIGYSGFIGDGGAFSIRYAIK